MNSTREHTTLQSPVQLPRVQRRGESGDCKGLVRDAQSQQHFNLSGVSYFSKFDWGDTHVSGVDQRLDQSLIPGP